MGVVALRWRAVTPASVPFRSSLACCAASKSARTMRACSRRGQASSERGTVLDGLGAHSARMHPCTQAYGALVIPCALSDGISETRTALAQTDSQLYRVLPKKIDVPTHQILHAWKALRHSHMVVLRYGPPGGCRDRYLDRYGGRIRVAVLTSRRALTSLAHDTGCFAEIPENIR